MILDGPKEVRITNELGGHRVRLAWLPESDGMWELLAHEALFANRWDAERLAARVTAAGKIDLAHWTWHPNRCSPLAALQQLPTARLETTPRPASAACLAWQARPTID